MQYDEELSVPSLSGSGKGLLLHLVQYTTVWVIQKTNYPLTQPTDLHIRSFLVPFRMHQAQAASYSPDMHSSPTILSCSDYQVVGTHGPLGSFIVHFKLPFLLICLISVTLWDSPTKNNGCNEVWFCAAWRSITQRSLLLPGEGLGKLKAGLLSGKTGVFDAKCIMKTYFNSMQRE